MASGPTLPPQAYTREILTAAFNWLQTQPESVKKIASTPDALVGLYMRAQRFGNSSLEADAPVSSQNFMSDLKNLAEGLRQFEGPAEERIQSEFRQPPPERPTNYRSGSGAYANHHPQPPIQAPPLQQAFAQQTSAQQTLPQQTVVGLNDRSCEMIQEVKSHLNLSSDVEAVNMMIALAYKNLKNLLV